MKRKNVFSIWHMTTSVFMVAALLWLTISTPFVYAADQLTKQEIQKQTGQAEDDEGNPFSNTTEEKNQNGVNSLSEYLHDHHLIEHDFIIITKYYKCQSADAYLAFHPESFSPPPEA
jgi:hypothetical protein